MYHQFQLLLVALLSGANAFSPVLKAGKVGDQSIVDRLVFQQRGAGVVTDDIDIADSSPHLVFPGGGIFFYWQAGAVTYLREQGYDLSQTTMAGASAGALTATLTACEVDFEEATRLALDLAQEAGVWDRKGGLQGVWGPMISSWLDTLLPSDAPEMVKDRLTLLVTPVPSFGKNKVSHFSSKNDLIDCNMASVHLPWFLDGKLTSNFRQSPHIDGSFLSKPEHYNPRGLGQQPTVQLDWTKDPVMNEKAAEFVKLVSKDGIWDMLETGRKFASKMEKQGDFDSLRFLQNTKGSQENKVLQSVER